MSFRASFCDPFKSEIVELGEIRKDKIMEHFEGIPWNEYLEKMKTAKESDLYYSPSLEIENIENKNGLSVSAVDGKEWYIFFKRPKMIKRFFGLSEKMKNNYLTDITGQTIDDVRKCLKALINNDLKYLEEKIK